MKTIGLRCKSGYAIALIIEGSRKDWQITGRMEIPLTAGTGKYARFPYHPLIELDAPAAAAVSKDAVATVRREARVQMDRLLATLGTVHGAGIVTGSLIDPEKIANPHMRAHAREGQLFREVVAGALDRGSVAYQILSDRNAFQSVATQLSMPEGRLKDRVNNAGRSVVKPYRADEKLAAVAAIWALMTSAG